MLVLFSAESGFAGPGPTRDSLSAGTPVDSGVAPAGDGPPGFWWGTDSGGPAPAKSGTCGRSALPWLEPKVRRAGSCGRYGGYLGEIGGYWTVLGKCGSNHWNATAAKRATTNYSKYQAGIGTAAYWFGGGPGRDPHYDGTKSEAYAWGRRQAVKAWKRYSLYPQLSALLVILDVEDDWPQSGPPEGWNEVVRYSGSHPCGTVVHRGVDPAVARATVNGFLNYIWDHAFNGLYSSPSEWGRIFEHKKAGQMHIVMEWTAGYGDNCINPGPYGWTQAAGSCPRHSAHFFGGSGVHANCKVMWQWRGGQGDYDQIDNIRMYLCH